MQTFGKYIRNIREDLFKNDKSYSQRQVSLRIGIEPSYLSKIERGQPVALSEEKIIALAEDLGQDADHLLALGGKISGDVQEIIKKRPMLFSKLVREMKDLPDEAIEADKEFKQILGKLQRLHDMAAIGAFEFKNDQLNSYWTSQVPSILGLPADTAPCMESILEALLPDDHARFTELQEKTCGSQDAFHCELQLGSQARPQRFIQIWGCHEKGEDNIFSTIGIIQDVSEIVQLRNEIQDAKDSLQETVTEQGVELSDAIKKLKAEIASRKTLEEKLRTTNETIREQANIQNAFFKDRAYGLRTLLNRHIATLSEADGVCQTKLSIKRISSKINEMDDFFASGESLFYEELEFNLHETLESIAFEFEDDFKLNDISLSLYKSPNLPAFVASDKRRIEQILTALLELFLVNTPWGYVQISATFNTAKNDFVLSLTSPSKKWPVDTNAFYPNAVIEENSHTPNPAQQTGPLLDSICGSLSVEDTSGEGVLVNIHIPIKTYSDEQKKRATHTEERTALVVEDDQYSLIYISKALESRGFDVTTATNGNEAIEQSQSRKFSVILLDIQLPDIDGIKVAKQIRQDSKSPNIDTPIIAVTAHATQADRHEYLNSGMNGFIPKPFELDTLSEEVFRLFD